MTEELNARAESYVVAKALDPVAFTPQMGEDGRVKTDWLIGMADRRNAALDQADALMEKAAQVAFDRMAEVARDGNRWADLGDGDEREWHLWIHRYAIAAVLPDAIRQAR